MADPTEETRFGHTVPILGSETGSGGTEEAQHLQAEEQRLGALSQENLVNEIKELINQSQLQAYAKEAKQHILQKSRDDDGRLIAPDQLSGEAKDAKSPRGKAASAKEAAQRILLAAKTGKLQEPAGAAPGTRGSINEFSAKSIQKISDTLPAAAVSENSGAFLYDLFSKLLKNEIHDFQGIINNSGEIGRLASIDPFVYDRLTDALKTIGREEGGIDAEWLDARFPKAEVLEKSREEDATDEDLRQMRIDLQRALRRYINDRDEEVIGAIYSPRLFMNYIKTVEANEGEKYGKKLTQLRRDAPDSEAYWEEVSAIVTREIGFTFGKLYRSAASAHKDKFLDEIANANALESINLARTYLDSALLKLSERFTERDVRKKFGIVGIDDDREKGAMRFFSKRQRQFETERVIEYEDEHGKPQTHTVLMDRRISVGRAEEVEIYEFLSGVKYQVERFIDHVLPYNHNVQALFLRGPGQDGTFWGQIGGFAGANLSTIDLDSLNDIPDAEYVHAAFRLYSKYVKADFSRFDWNNNPGRFLENYDTPNTPIQLDVVKDLKRLFPELKEHHHKWRIDQAMNIAIGVSRGVFLTEPTSAAWADAPHDGEGRATFDSYYTNSNVALLGLNMAHGPDRWKTPAVTAGPLLHTPVAGESPGTMRRIFASPKWDHVKLWEWMKRRENSYVNGLRSFGESQPLREHRHGYKHDDTRLRARFGRFYNRFTGNIPLTRAHGEHKRERWETRGERRLLTFIDALPNIANVGGPIERAGWRNKAYEGWVVYDHHGNANPVETFKSLENIGFEAVKWWVNGPGKLSAVKLEHDEHGGGNFTPEFGKYLFDKYIQPNSSTTASYEEYVDAVKTKVVQKSGKKAENQYAGVLVNRALAYMLKERVPTLMVAIERTRLTDNSKRAWRTLRERCGWGENERIGEIKDTNRMDRALKNIMLVEQRVRQTTSAQMQKSVNDQVAAHREDPHYKPNLREVEEGHDNILKFEVGKEYRVTEERLKKELTFLFTGEEDGTIPPGTALETEYNDAVKLFQETQTYLDADYMNDFAEKIRLNGKPEKFFPFAIAAEELDTSFMTFQSSGPDVMKRALGEIGAVETNIVKNIQENFIGKLRDVAMVEKKYDSLVHAIHEVHKQLDSLHGEAYANGVADYMARIAISYFKKDSDVIGFFGKVKNLGKPHSLAGHFAGGSWKGVWEWEVGEQDTFLRILDERGILPDRPRNLNKPEHTVKKKFLGLTYGYERVVLEDEPGDFEHSGLKTRKEMGAKYSDIAREMIRKYLLFGVVALLAIYISRAFKEAGEKKGH